MTTSSTLPFHRRGRIPKGGTVRHSAIAKFPPELYGLLLDSSTEYGMPLTDYITWQVCKAEGWPVPAYILDQLAAARGVDHVQPSLLEEDAS